jgi:hypothetical protein
MNFQEAAVGLFPQAAADAYCIWPQLFFLCENYIWNKN